MCTLKDKEQYPQKNILIIPNNIFSRLLSVLFFQLYLKLFLCIYASLHQHMCTTSTNEPWRSEEGIGTLWNYVYGQ